MDQGLVDDEEVSPVDQAAIDLVRVQVPGKYRLVFFLLSNFSRVRPLQLFIKSIIGLLLRIICWCMYVDGRIVEESAFYSKYAETLVYGYEVCSQMVNFRIHEESCSKILQIHFLIGIPNHYHQFFLRLK
jgi:hypothetical protein